MTLLDQLLQIDGVWSVQASDTSSTGTMYRLRLSADQIGSKPYRFVVPIRTIKAAIRRLCKATFASQPKMTYSTVLGEKAKVGYNSDFIEIVV